MSDTESDKPVWKVRHALHAGPEYDTLPLPCEAVLTQFAIRSIASQPVIVYVGEARKPFYVHERLLRSYSGFFDTALKKEWKESDDRAINLPDADHKTFTIWVKWVYTGRLFLKKEDDLVTCEGGDTGDVTDKKWLDVDNEEWLRWGKAYLLGDYLQDTDFKDAVIDSMIAGLLETGYYPYTLASYIYPCSAKTSAHRKLAVDVFVFYWTRTDLGEHDQPKEFLLDALRFIGPGLEAGIVGVEGIENLFDVNNTCNYHDHGLDKPCYKTKPAFRF
jgi:hypothetical protein